MQLNIFDEIFVDNFAGGGGASTGIELAIGRPINIAVNHDIDAIAMHKENHPYTKHYCESVWDINPQKVCEGHKVALAWFSPDCKHFSRAKGGKPVSKNIRGLAWVALRWAATIKPRVIIIENVKEFMTWCPLNSEGCPDFTQKGRTFNSFVNAFKSQGYEVQWKILKACDYGTPTIRERFFLVARCDGKPIVFPTPTHAHQDSEAVKSGKLLPWRTSGECIDFNLQGKSIFNRTKPLAENTQKRIAKGIDKFVIKSTKPFIVPIGYGERNGQTPRLHDISEPMSTIVSSCKQYVVSPSLIQYHSETNSTEVRGQELTEPIMTLDTQPRYALNMAHLVKYYGNVVGISLDTPVPTVTAIDHNALSIAHLVEYYTNEQHGTSLYDPLHTVTTRDRMGLVSSQLCVLRNNMDCKELTEPMPTITTNAGHFAEVKTYLTKITSNMNLHNWNEIRKLLNQYSNYNIADDEVLIITINNTGYFIADITLRMLEPKELYKAQGFPSDYKFAFTYNGKPYSKSAQVARCGNSVCPPIATALVKANLPEYCKGQIKTMAELNNRIAI